MRVMKTEDSYDKAYTLDELREKMAKMPTSELVENIIGDLQSRALLNQIAERKLAPFAKSGDPSVRVDFIRSAILSTDGEADIPPVDEEKLEAFEQGLDAFRIAYDAASKKLGGRKLTYAERIDLSADVFK